MGKPSNTNPTRPSTTLRAQPRGRLTLLGAGLLLACTAVSGNAQATAVPLVLPSALVFDAQGNLYFAETGNHVIREFSVGGVLTTVAGNGVQGFAGDQGPAISSELDSPGGLTIDTSGNLFIADTHNHRVREVVAATGIINTIAGTGAAGSSGDGGAASAAQLDHPTALAIDSAGNLFIADIENHRVRRISAAGVIATIAGSGVEGFSGDGGPATAAAIDSPDGLAIDPAGDLYIADTHNGRVRMVAATTGIITTVAGSGATGGNTQPFGGDGGAATAAGLDLPRGLTLDSTGNLFLADSENHRVRKISGGQISTVAGQGTQDFAGDGAPAVAANLDTPRSVAVSPAGLLTLADTHNQRVRQLDALPAPGPDIHTIAGLGVASTASLTLGGPSVSTYGSGSLTATLNVAGNATGTITFLDASDGATSDLGSATLIANSADLNIGTLPAGTHSIFATYPGDATHGTAQSSTLALSVAPLSITATPDPAGILYGQPVPSLSGVLSGVLPQDTGKLAAIFTTAATALSAAGVYPIAVTLTGSAAGNYTAAVSPASLTIAQAPTLTSLSTSNSAPLFGAPVTLTIHASSTTTGLPTGNIALLDGPTILSSAPLAAGSAVIATSSLARGTHSLSAIYLGDSNFLSSTSGPTSLVVGTAPSVFTLTATGATSQSVQAGNAATFNFSVAMQGAALASPITLAVQGTPAGAIASFNPSYLPPGGTITNFTLTIQTPMASLNTNPRPFGPASPPPSGATILAALLFPALSNLRRAARKRSRSVWLIFITAASCVSVATFASGCGNRVNTASEAVDSTSYALTITGTATSSAGTPLQQSANVTLQLL